MAKNMLATLLSKTSASLGRGLSFLGKVIKNLAVNDPKAWEPSLWNLRGSQSLSGEVVTEETALTYSAVWCAVNLISGTVSTLPLHLSRKEQRRTLKAVENPLYSVLHDQANPYMSAQIYRETMMAHTLLWGNCYSEIQRNTMGDVVALWPIPPNRVRMVIENGVLLYKVQVNGEEIPLPRERVLHIPGLGYDGMKGYSVVEMARKSIGLGMAMETFGARYFGAGTHPGVIVSHPGTLSPEASSNMQRALSEVYSGLGQSHRLMLLEDGLKIEKLGIPPNESQFLESRQFQIPEIARWFNLPPHKLKDLTKSSFNNIESEQISFVTDSILHWLVRFEQCYNMQLLSDVQKKQLKLYFRHNVDGLMRGDSKSRAEYYFRMFRSGFITINEVRELENWDPSDDEFADEHFITADMIPLSRLGTFLDSKNTANVIPKGQNTGLK